VGSGLILLLIVGAWLAVLVPMALRSHDAGSSLRSTERFGDAMRVLSRRDGSRAERAASATRDGGAFGDCDSFGESGVPATDRELPPFEAMLRSERNAPAPPLTAVQRRLRVLLTLVGGTVSALLLGIVLRPALWVGLGLLVLTVAFCAHLRRLALLRAARLHAEAAPVEPHWVAPVVRGIPDRMPARPAPLLAPPARWEEVLPAAAARWDDPLPAAAGGEWSPVPVPLPVYATKPVAPPRPPRVLDLTSPGVWTASSDLELEGEPDVELDEILERRRAVGGW
jgi:hypothetical protein